jgi:hypothetical protein
MFTLCTGQGTAQGRHCLLNPEEGAIIGLHGRAEFGECIHTFDRLQNGKVTMIDSRVAETSNIGQ